MIGWDDLEQFGALNAALRELLALDAQTRAARLAQICTDRPELAEKLTQLLHAAEPDAASNALPDSVRDAVLSSLLPFRHSPLLAGAQLGDWKLSKYLGAGGMADVWLAHGCNAHQDQRAAIKRPSLDLCSPQGALRFERERALLAGLDDQRIARLIDSGVDAAGYPWLAMEYVDGERIDHWCDLQKLSLKGRIHLVAEVARAAHSAHSALIVHRDIKPANVLVRTDGAIKLLDFGIAKLLQSDAGSVAEAPTLGHALTPQYASPEQFLGQTITTASDVYQLGSLLCELLAGARPNAAQHANVIALAEAVLHAAARSPSQIYAALTEEQKAKIAILRGTQSDALARALRGDLDAICQHAMAREPQSRYASALHLAQDLEAYLQQQPVQARAPRISYRFSKLLRRNVWTSVATALLLLVLIAFVSVSLVQAERIRQEASANVVVRDYLIQVLRQTDPLYAHKGLPTTAALLEQALSQARAQFHEQPELLAEVLKIGADSVTRQGDFKRALDLYSEAVAVARSPNAALPASSRPSQIRQTQILANYGQALHYEARYAESEQTLRTALAQWRAQGAPGNPMIALALVDVLHSRGSYHEALGVLDEVDAMPINAFARAMWQRDRGTVLRDSADPGARALLETALASLLSKFSQDKASIASAQIALARLEINAGNAEVARALLQSALEKTQKIVGSKHPQMGIARHALAMADALVGDFPQAIETLSGVLKSDYQATPPSNVLPSYARLDRAWCLLAIGRDAEALEDLRLAEASLRAVAEIPHPRWAEAQLAFALIAVRSGDVAAARTYVEQAIAANRVQFGERHALTDFSVRWRTALDAQQGALTPESLTKIPALFAQRLRLFISALPRR
jgi:eukaryotic-like serine/threonine-protein kinase